MGTREQFGLFLAVAWRVLRPGGVLAVTTTARHHGGRFIDPGPRIIRQAQSAGFRYAQHVIALRVPIDGDTLVVQAGPADLAQPRDTRARALPPPPPSTPMCAYPSSLGPAVPHDEPHPPHSEDAAAVGAGHWATSVQAAAPRPLHARVDAASGQDAARHRSPGHLHFHRAGRLGRRSDVRDEPEFGHLCPGNLRHAHAQGATGASSNATTATRPTAATSPTSPCPRCWTASGRSFPAPPRCCARPESSPSPAARSASKASWSTCPARSSTPPTGTASHHPVETGPRRPHPEDGRRPRSGGDARPERLALVAGLLIEGPTPPSGPPNLRVALGSAGAPRAVELVAPRSHDHGAAENTRNDVLGACFIPDDFAIRSYGEKHSGLTQVCGQRFGAN